MVDVVVVVVVVKQTFEMLYSEGKSMKGLKDKEEEEVEEEEEEEACTL